MGFWDDLLNWLFGRNKTVLVLTASLNGNLGQTVIMTGKLVRKNNMTPIANANITVTVTDPTGVATPQTKTTDATGKFSVSVILAKSGNYVIKADSAGIAHQYDPVNASVTIIAYAASVPVTMTLTPSATSGTVGDTITIAGSMQTA